MPSLHARDALPKGRSFAQLGPQDSDLPAGGLVDGEGGLPKARNDDCIDVLTRMVEGEIIPRLLLAHQSGLVPPKPLSPPVLGPEAVENFAKFVLNNGTDVLVAHVAALLENGARLQSIYMDLLAPTARRIGDYWDADLCSFVDVTEALGKLQFLLHDLGRRDTSAREGGQGRSILLATPQEEQHTFGLLVVEELFRRGGWRTWSEPRGEPAALARMAAGQWFDLFGVSVSTEAHLGAASAMIASVRGSSRNRFIRVIVGGRLFGENPGLAADVGADAVTSGGNEAVAEAEQIVGRIEGRG